MMNDATIVVAVMVGMFAAIVGAGCLVIAVFLAGVKIVRTIKHWRTK